MDNRLQTTGDIEMKTIITYKGFNVNQDDDGSYIIKRASGGQWYLDGANTVEGCIEIIEAYFI